MHVNFSKILILYIEKPPNRLTLLGLMIFAYHRDNMYLLHIKQPVYRKNLWKEIEF